MGHADCGVIEGCRLSCSIILINNTDSEILSGDGMSICAHTSTYLVVPQELSTDVNRGLQHSADPDEIDDVEKFIRKCLDESQVQQSAESSAPISSTSEESSGKSKSGL